MKKVLALGNALTDILMQVSDEQVQALGLEKGSMNHISFESARYIQEKFSTVRKSMIAGGSASNTVNALAALGASAAFIGKIGNDEIGEFFRQNAEHNGVRPILLPSRLMSGNCIALITPDGERTFATYLGAAANLKPENIMPEMFTSYDYFHIEGYIVQNHELIEKAMRLAKEAGLIVSLDLASFNVVNDNRDFLTDLVDKYVDIIFANEDESYAYTHLQPEESVASLAKQCCIAVVKVGKDGSYVQQGEERFHVPAVGTQCIDSTGAGDYYAAGFLYGLAHGLDLRACASIGTMVAGRVCEVLGAKLPEETWHELRGLINALYEQ
ncbi:MAG: adenosine kinase [Paludibacteraceae bacterium]|nr:adenosine kinase [Paludibacteraceae bacterium]